MQETFSAIVRKSGQTSSLITIPSVVIKKLKIANDTIVKVSIEK